MQQNSIGVIGSGIMGSGIAEVLISNGYSATVKSRSQDTCEKLITKLEKSLDRLVQKEKITQEEKIDRMSRLHTTTEIADLKDCSIVIESVVEDLPTKQTLFKELESIVDPNALLASNTSTFPLVDMAIQCHHSERVVGIHFFNPAPLMSLIEVVQPITASKESIERAVRFAESLGKSPIVVKDQAGFVLNALLFPYLNNAIHLYEMGVATKEDIDKAMKGGAGFPMGPFELLDLVGLDTSLSILETLHNEYRDPNFAPRPLLKRMVAAGRLGRKTKEGFYEYD
jgi:3-hydroxybutyryl-CoA dehydrogenase